MAKSSTDSLSFIRITSKSLLKLCPSQLTLKSRPLELLDKLPQEPYDPFVRLLLNSELRPTLLVLCCYSTATGSSSPAILRRYRIVFSGELVQDQCLNYHHLANSGDFRRNCSTEDL
ncbi:hypothetical protein LXL04_024128 [Taraxacum kok-saghyz]